MHIQCKFIAHSMHIHRKFKTHSTHILTHNQRTYMEAAVPSIETEADFGCSKTECMTMLDNNGTLTPKYLNIFVTLIPKAWQIREKNHKE